MKRAAFNPWRELAGLAVLGMEVAWVTAWVLLLMRPTAQVGVGRTLAGLAGVALAVYGWAHLGAWFALRHNLLRGGLLALLVGSVGFGWRMLIAHAPAQAGLDALLTRSLDSFTRLTDVVPPEVVVLCAVLTLGWLATRLATMRVGPMMVGRRFRFGTGCFALWAALALGRLDAGGSGLFALFMGAALVAMAAARVAVVGTLRGGRRSPFTRRWLGALLGAVSGLVAVAGGLAVWLAQPVAAWGHLLLVRLVQAVVVLVSSPLVALLVALAPWLQGLQEQLAATVPETPPLTPTPSAAEQLRRQMEQLAPRTPGLAPDWSLVKAVLSAAGVSLLVALILRGASRVTRGREEAVEEGLEPLESGGWWPRLRRVLSGRAGGPRRLSAAAQRRAAARIRRIYADLLALGAQVGCPRPPEVTPLEYIPLLMAAVPEQAALQHITQAYLRVRYGELPETAEEVRQVERAWRTVQRAAHGLEVGSSSPRR